MKSVVGAIDTSPWLMTRTHILNNKGFSLFSWIKIFNTNDLKNTIDQIREEIEK